MLSQIISEIPWNAFASVFMWALIYYPVGFQKMPTSPGKELSEEV